MDRRRFLSILGAGALVPVAAEGQQAQNASRAAIPPAPPQASVSPLPPDMLGGRTIRVRAGENLQAALDRAQPQDTLVLDGGVTWVGNYKLPSRSDNSWVAIRGSAESSLPQSGHRVTPEHSAAMPKLSTPNADPALTAPDGTQGWRFVGIEISKQPTVPGVWQLCALGSTRHASVTSIPRRFAFERCYVHGHPDKMTRRGFMMNSADTQILDSLVNEIHESGADSQAVCCWDGIGPFRLRNNRLEASGENVMFGGGPTSLPNLVPSDIEIVGNHFFKPLRWKAKDPAYDGKRWTVKNLLEFKSGQRVRVEGNIFENTWQHAQTGTAILFTPRNDNAPGSWAVVQDILFTNNDIKNVNGCFLQQGVDETRSQGSRRIAIVNNRWLDVHWTLWTMLGPGEDLVVEHNTMLPGGYLLFLALPSAFKRLRVANNILGLVSRGFAIDGGVATWDQIAPDRTFASNAVVKLAPAGGMGAGKPTEFKVFPSPSLAGIDPTNGGLAATSPLKTAGTDGKDIGVDLETLNSALRREASSAGGPR